MLKLLQKIYDVILVGWMSTSGILMVIILAIPAIMALFSKDALSVLQFFLLSVSFLGGVIIGNGLRISNKKEITAMMATIYFMIAFVIWLILSIAISAALHMSKESVTFFVIILGLMEGLIFGFIKPANVQAAEGYDYKKDKASKKKS